MKTKGIRINKYLADAGICSRRQADTLIACGTVKINGKVAVAGTRVTDADDVEVDNKKVSGKAGIHTLVYYKPVGVTCTERDVHAKKTVTSQLGYPIRVTYAGRLDRDSEGLLIMTNDGYLINSLMRAANCHEKEYIVRTKQEVTQEFLDQLGAGVYLQELNQKTRPCKVERVGKHTFRIVLTQGLNRQIRRMCESFGVQILSLKRIRIVNIELGKLKPGEYRKLTDEEQKELYLQIGMNQNSAGEGNESIG